METTEVDDKNNLCGIVSRRNIGYPINLNENNHGEPFKSDTNGFTRDSDTHNIYKVKIKADHGIEKSFQAALVAIQTEYDSHNCYHLFTCPRCGLCFLNPKRFLVHFKWHHFGNPAVKTLNNCNAQNAKHLEKKSNNISGEAVLYNIKPFHKMNKKKNPIIMKNNLPQTMDETIQYIKSETDFAHKNKTTTFANQRFQECSELVIAKTPVWEFFWRETSGEFAKCKTCLKVLKTTGKSTSGLHKHMSSIHSNVNMKRPAPEHANPPTKRIHIENHLITNYFGTGDTSLEAVLARMTSVDGLPFGVFVTSTEMRKSLQARGFDLPKCSKAIRDMVMKYGNRVRQKYTTTFHSLKAKGGRFSLTFDEWTSTRNRRYLNINLRANKQFWNLGLVRVRGPVDMRIKLLEAMLESFGLNLNEDIVCITADGFIQDVPLLSCKRQLCFARAIHLAVLDVLYEKPEPKCLPKDDDSDSDDESDGFQIDEANLWKMAGFIDPLIRKVRAVVKLFRKSPSWNAILQKHTKEQLICDAKTRWSSLFYMLQRFNHVKSCILKSLFELGSPVSFEREELELIHDLVETLEPVKLAVDAFCRRDATLLSADTTISFMMNNLGTSSFAHRLKQSLAHRINGRRTRLSSLLQFLHKGNQDYAELNLDPLLHFERLNKSTITAMVIDTLGSVEHDSISACESDVATVEEVELNLSLQEKLDRAIHHGLNVKIASKSKTAEDIVKKELANFKFETRRGANLERCYEDLKLIPPAGVESDRVFSGGELATLIRSSLDDDSLDTLILLRSHFKTLNSE